MDRRRFLATLPALAAATRLSPTAWARHHSSSLESGLWSFAQDLFHQVAVSSSESKFQNIFLSPLSIATALAMTARGAGGTTLKEMGDVLHWPMEKDTIHAALGHLIKSLTESKGKDSPQMEVANSLFGSSEMFLKPDFKNTLKRDYSAGLQPTNFKQPELARRQINDWVAAQTQSKIKDLFPAGIINELTRLVLVNAIYFKGAWRYRFEKSATREAPFYGTSEVKVPMMQLAEKLRYGEGPNYQIVELPYRGSDLAMVIVLPRNRDPKVDLVKVEPKPTERGQEHSAFAKNVSMLDEMKTQMVLLSLPRFHNTGEFRLDDVLKKLGMQQAFSTQADFSRMTDGRDIFIQAVVHKAVIDVNEEGTEAAAATGVAAGERKAPQGPRPKVVVCDHPFYYFIRDTKSNVILFMGRLVDPTS